MHTDADLNRDGAEEEGAVRRAFEQQTHRRRNVMCAAVNRLAFEATGIASLPHAVPWFRAVGASMPASAAAIAARHLVDAEVIGVAAGGEGEERVLAERVQSVAGAFLVEQANELQFPLAIDRRVEVEERVRANDKRQVDAKRGSVRACDLVSGRQRGLDGGGCCR